MRTEEAGAGIAGWGCAGAAGTRPLLPDAIAAPGAERPGLPEGDGLRALYEEYARQMGTAQPPEAGPLTGGLSRGYGGSVLPPWAAGSPLAREYFLRMDPGTLPLYQEYLQRVYGEQLGVPRLPEWSGGGWEDLADDGGGALVPMVPDAALPEQGGTELEPLVENPIESDIIEDILIYKSLGAKAKNYPIWDPFSGKYYYLVEGSRIKNPKVFAGKGGAKPLRPGTVEGLTEQFGGKPSEWQHCKGIGLLDCEGEECEAEIHWFQEPSAGKHQFKVKIWLD